MFSILGKFWKGMAFFIAGSEQLRTFAFSILQEDFLSAVVFNNKSLDFNKKFLQVALFEPTLCSRVS